MRGARALDPQFDEMAKSFRFGAGKTLRHVVLPQLQPFFAAAARSGLALIWKIVLVVELLGRSSGVGFKIQTYFQLFEIGYIFVYALAFMAVIQLIDMLLSETVGAPREPLAARARMISVSVEEKHFGDRPVLTGVAFTLEPGAFLAIVGPSGCGKTTLLRIIAGIDADFRGDV